MTAKAERCHLGYFSLSKCPPARGLSRVPPTLTQRTRLAMLSCRWGPQITGSWASEHVHNPFRALLWALWSVSLQIKTSLPGLRLSRTENGRAGLVDSLTFPRSCGVRLPCLREEGGGLPESGAKSPHFLSGHPLSSKEKSSGVRQAPEAPQL